MVGMCLLMAAFAVSPTITFGSRVLADLGVRAHEKAQKSGLGSLGCLGPSGFLRALGITEPIAVAFDRDDLGVVREPIDQRDGAGGVGKDRGVFSRICG